MNGTRTTPRVMLLIDADNVTADVIAQAVQHTMTRHGAAHVRRAYCTAELALKQLKLFKTHSIRPIVNVSTGKNSTDIALAVDAMELVVAERPDVVVIVSSDSDFAPLVIRLREKGCRVEGIGQEGKTGEDSKPVYDDFIDIPHRKAKAAPLKTTAGRRSSRSAAPVAPPEAEAPAPRAAAGRGRSRATAASPRAAALPVLEEWPELAGEPPSASASASASSPAPEAPARPAARKRASRASTAAVVTAKAPADAARVAAPRAVSRPTTPPAPPALPEEVQRILAALPELRQGGRMQLNLAKERLSQAGLLARNAPSTKFFRRHPGLFELTPDKNPNRVHFLGDPGRSGSA